MSTSTCSYTFDQFQAQSKLQEISRLDRKASILQSIDQKACVQAGLNLDMTVLDLGCGSGTWTCELAQMVYPGRTVGVDTSLSMVAHASSNCTYDNVSFQLGNAYELEFPESTFDIVYARFLFQHLAEPLKALANIYRVLKPGGKLCVVDVDDDWFTLYPEPDSFQLFRQRIVEIQQAEGGDPYIGRRLHHYFSQTGLHEILSSVQILGHPEYDTATLLSLLSFGAPYYAAYPNFAKLAQQAKLETYELMKKVNLWSSFGVFIGIGTKPI